MKAICLDSGMSAASSKAQVALLDKLIEEIMYSFAEYEGEGKPWVVRDKRRCFEIETLMLIKFKIQKCRSVSK